MVNGIISLISLSDLSLLVYRNAAGEGNGNPLQCFCLENPRDGGAWWDAIYGVAQSRTLLKRLSRNAADLNANKNYNKVSPGSGQNDLHQKGYK